MALFNEYDVGSYWINFTFNDLFEKNFDKWKITNVAISNYSNFVFYLEITLQLTDINNLSYGSTYSENGEKIDTVMFDATYKVNENNVKDFDPYNNCQFIKYNEIFMVGYNLDRVVE